MAGLKTCRRCAKERPLDAFGHDASRPDGLAHWCKPCRAEHRARPETQAKTHAWLEANRAKVRADSRKRNDAWLERAAADPEKWDAYRRLKIAATRRFCERHPDVVRRWQRARTQRYRARRRGNLVIPFTQAQLEARLSMYGHRCWMCGGEATEVDHVKPLSKGGAHCLANLRPACKPCNTRRGARWPLERQVAA